MLRSSRAFPGDCANLDTIQEDGIEGCIESLVQALSIFVHRGEGHASGRPRALTIPALSILSALFQPALARLLAVDLVIDASINLCPEDGYKSFRVTYWSSPDIPPKRLV